MSRLSFWQSSSDIPPSASANTRTNHCPLRCCSCNSTNSKPCICSKGSTISAILCRIVSRYMVYDKKEKKSGLYAHSGSGYVTVSMTKTAHNCKGGPLQLSQEDDPGQKFRERKQRCSSD